MNRGSIYTSPHPQQVQHQPMQYQVQRQQPQMQLPPNVQIVQTQYGPQYMDSNTGAFLMPQQVQMMLQQMQQQQVQQLSPQQLQFLAQQHRAAQQQQFGQNSQGYPQQRLMGGAAQAFQADLMPETVDNRFDGPIRQPLPSPVQQHHQDNNQMRVPSNQANTTVIIEQKRFVPGKKMLKSKNASFLPRTRPFEKKEVEVLSMNVHDGGFSMAVEELYQQSFLEVNRSKLVIIAQSKLVDSFYDTSLRSQVGELFQRDIESVYRFMKQAVDNLTTRSDIVFMSEYNQWLTDQVNDTLRVLMPLPASIDSFVEDFNDLKFALGDKRTPKEELGTIYEELRTRLNKMLVTIEEEHAKEEIPENHGNPVHLVEKTNIVFCKLMSTELWQDGVPDKEPSGNRLISSLADFQKEDIFYLFTLDKVVYKVTVNLERIVMVDMIGN